MADVEQARVNEVNRQAEELKDKQDAENARLENIDWVRRINRAIFSAFIDSGLEKRAATMATQALIDKKIPNTAINY